MAKEILKYLLLFVVLVVAQVVVFNHLCLFNVAVPLVFIYFIVKLPVNLSVNWAMAVSFLLGLMVDIFSNTQGMNALACTVLAAIRLPMLRLYFPREEDNVESRAIIAYPRTGGLYEISADSCRPLLRDVLPHRGVHLL